MSKFNYFQRLDVTTTDFADQVLSWDFISAGLIFLNESIVSGRIIEYSFDGSTLHGDLDPDLPSAGLAFNSRHESKVYFRLKTEGAGVVVRVEAWA